MWRGEGYRREGVAVAPEAVVLEGRDGQRRPEPPTRIPRLGRRLGWRLGRRLGRRAGRAPVLGEGEGAHAGVAVAEGAVVERDLREEKGIYIYIYI